MKRFTTATAVFGVSILAVWAIFQVFTASQSQAKDHNAAVRVQPANNEVMKAVDTGNGTLIPVTGSENRNIAPVFDSSGAVLSDPSGTLLSARGSEERMIAPVFDANGSVVSDPSGTILNPNQP